MRPGERPARGAAVDPGALAASFALLWFAVLVLRHAWLCDDAHITFRTIDHFLAGRGLVWNEGERVQVYTHPLWMFVVAGAVWVTGEYLYTVTALGAAFSVAAAWLVAFRIARTRTAATLALVGLASSKAFVDYSTSGLENPLSHFLLALFFALALGRREKPPSGRRLVGIASVAALGMVNRLDLALVFAPALAALWWRRRDARGTACLALGFWPLVAWEVFSILYYGFPFPNTAYAKLAVGADPWELLYQGLFYLMDAAARDPMTLILLGCGLALPLYERERECGPVVAGAVLYVAYTVKIGGDFMMGRFLAAPLFCAAITVSRSRLLPAGAWGLAPALVLVLVTSAAGLSSYRSDALYAERTGYRVGYGGRGVADERQFFYPTLGLLSFSRLTEGTENKWAKEGLLLAGDGTSRERPLARRATIGLFAFHAGPRAIVVDPVSLAEPLLARLPPMWNPAWRIGHFRRHVPEGYEETLRTGQNRLRDPKLARYYDELALVIRGPLWSLARFRAIWRLNTGRLDHLIDRDRYRFPHVVRKTLADLAQPKEDGTPYDAPGNVIIPYEGGVVVIDVGRVSHASSVKVSFDGNDDYELAYFRGGEFVGFQIVRAPRRPGLASQELAVPHAVRHEGFDVIKVIARKGDRRYSIGHLRLVEE